MQKLPCMMKTYWSLFAFVSILLACQSKTKPQPLPILGEREVVNGDTVYPKIADFAFVNQDSQIVTNGTFADKIYVVDFFFTSCPTICPKTTKQMLRIYERFKNDNRVLLLAHSVDTKRDTVGKLKEYANSLSVDAKKWHFVTGKKEEIYGIADDYFSVAIENPDAPGGFDHSGRLILVDKNRHVRAFCNGTEPAEVDRFMEDIDKLLMEQLLEKGE
jgi:protein SCO1/2